MSQWKITNETNLRPHGVASRPSQRRIPERASLRVSDMPSSRLLTRGRSPRTARVMSSIQGQPSVSMYAGLSSATRPPGGGVPHYSPRIAIHTGLPQHLARRHVSSGSWLCENPSTHRSSARLIRAEAHSRTNDSQTTDLTFGYCVTIDVSGVFTQPGSFATGSSQQQVRQCPLCRCEFNRSVQHRL